MLDKQDVDSVVFVYSGPIAIQRVGIKFFILFILGICQFLLQMLILTNVSTGGSIVTVLVAICECFPLWSS